MNSSEFDRRFEEGESVIDALDLYAARRPRLEQRRVNVDFPIWMVEQLDLETIRVAFCRSSFENSRWAAGVNSIRQAKIPHHLIQWNGRFTGTVVGLQC